MLHSEEVGFLLLAQAEIDFTENRKILAAITENAALDGVLTVENVVFSASAAYLRFVGDVLVELQCDSLCATNFQIALAGVARNDEVCAVDQHQLIKCLCHMDCGLLRFVSKTSFLCE